MPSSERLLLGDETATLGEEGARLLVVLGEEGEEEAAPARWRRSGGVVALALKPQPGQPVSVAEERHGGGETLAPSPRVSPSLARSAPATAAPQTRGTDLVALPPPGGRSECGSATSPRRQAEIHGDTGGAPLQCGRRRIRL